MNRAQPAVDSPDAAPKPFDVASVRRDFPILAQTLKSGRPIVYLDSAASAQKPQCVLDKQNECLTKYYANAYRGVYEFGARVDDELEESRATIARFIGAKSPEEVIFTSGATMSINLVAQAWGRKSLEPGDEVLLTLMEHHANIVPWQLICRERLATVRFIPLTSDGQLNLDRLDEVLTDRTRLVSLTAMSNVLGTINPIAEITERAKRRGALVMVDAAQSVPHGRVNVQDPAIDFLAFSGHKVYGPTGIGALYGRRALLDSMDPFLGGGHMIDEVFLDHSTWAEIPAKFEAGTIPIVEAIGLGEAIRYVAALGTDAIRDHEHQLVSAAFDRLSAIPGLQILGPAPDKRGGIVAFTVQGVHPHDMASLLDERGVAVRAGHHCTMPLHDWLNEPATTRASFGCYSTLDEVDALADAIRFARKTFRLAP